MGDRQRGASRGMMGRCHRLGLTALCALGLLALKPGDRAAWAGAAARPPVAAGRPAALPATATPDVTPDTLVSGGTGAEALAVSEAAVHLLRRATYGPTQEDLGELLAIGRDEWLDRQLQPHGIDDRALEPRLSDFPAVSMTPSELYASYPPPQVIRARLGNPDSISPQERRRLMRELGIQGPNRILFDMTSAKLQRAVYSERQLEEVMTDFWFNHFNVFFAKNLDRWLVSDYERNAIRPHVFGNFEDMLVATASHPAMLVYLDNWLSMVPDSLNPNLTRLDEATRRWDRLSARQRSRLLMSGRVTQQQLDRLERLRRQRNERERGLNENYARELLELHTLGVDGGYTQEDVVAVARAFTGWTIVRPGGPRDSDRGRRRRSAGQPAMMEGGAAEVRFQFRPEWHDPTPKTVLGQPLSGEGMEEGLEVLRIVARHPTTARHLATKLASAFASDQPSVELVDELAEVFLATNGDLREVTRTLFASEHFYSPENYGAKLKSPFELVASSLRVTGAEVGPSRTLIEQLRSLDHLPYMSSPPTGYPDVSEEWASAGALLQRLNFGLALAAGRLENVRIAPAGAASEAGPADAYVGAMLETVLPGTDVSRLEAAILADLEQRQDASPAAEEAFAPRAADRRTESSRRGRRQADPTPGSFSDLQRALGLALGSPEFQKH